MLVIKIVKILLLFFISLEVNAGGTVVGNGGDPLFEFIEATRVSMTETLKILLNDKKEQINYCKSTAISNEQIQFCQNYFLSIIPAILKLNQGTNKTLFVLRDEPLYVIGPDGNKMVVAARTELGPNGVIEINRDVLKTLPPTQILFLITHEFQHKVFYNGSYITDYNSIGPFAVGRDLIDLASKSLVTLAKKKGNIGNQFGIRDIFDCLVFTDNSNFGARLSSARYFQSEDLMSYETTFGVKPTDGTIYIPETINSSLVLKFKINEPNNCGDVNTKRNLFVQIVRNEKLKDNSTEETVVSEIESFSNPMCANYSSQFEISWNNVTFKCQYYGSEGTTSSFLNSKK